MSNGRIHKLGAPKILLAAILMMAGVFAFVASSRAQNVGLMVGQPGNPVNVTGAQNLIYGLISSTSTGSFFKLQKYTGSSYQDIFNIGYDGSITSTGVLTGTNTAWILNSGSLYASPTSLNVGIGLTNPGYKLDVNGTIRATAFTDQGRVFTDNIRMVDAAQSVLTGQFTLSSSTSSPPGVIVIDNSANFTPDLKGKAVARLIATSGTDTGSNPRGPMQFTYIERVIDNHTLLLAAPIFSAADSLYYAIDNHSGLITDSVTGTATSKVVGRLVDTAASFNSGLVGKYVAVVESTRSSLAMRAKVTQYISPTELVLDYDAVNSGNRYVIIKSADSYRYINSSSYNIPDSAKPRAVVVADGTYRESVVVEDTANGRGLQSMPGIERLRFLGDMNMTNVILDGSHANDPAPIYYPPTRSQAFALYNYDISVRGFLIKDFGDGGPYYGIIRYWRVKFRHMILAVTVGRFSVAELADCSFETLRDAISTNQGVLMLANTVTLDASYPIYSPWGAEGGSAGDFIDRTSSITGGTLTMGYMRSGSVTGTSVNITAVDANMKSGFIQNKLYATEGIFSGNVGMGLTTAGTRLDVGGTFRNSLATTHSLLGSSGNVVVMADNTGTLYTSSAASTLLWNGSTGGDIWNANSGNVGIGTTNPGALLEVKHPSGNLVTRFGAFNNSYNSKMYLSSVSSGDGGFQYLGSNRLDIFSYGDLTFNVGTGNISGAIANERMRIMQGGNVGIGTTNPTVKLQVDGQGGTGVVLSVTRDYNNAVQASRGGIMEFRPAYDTNGQGSIITTNYWGDVNQGTLTLNAYNQTNQLVVHRGGNVGIGTTAPDNKLTVKGLNALVDVQSQNDSENVGLWARYQNNASLGAKFRYSTGLATLTIENLYPKSAGTTYSDIYFKNDSAGATTVMTLKGDNASVGIGLTNPSTKLDVSGTFRNSLATTHSLLGASGNVVVMADNAGTLYTSPAGSSLLWSGSTGGNIWNANSGNVGIGITNPGAKFEVRVNTNRSFTVSELISTPNMPGFTAGGAMLGFSRSSDGSDDIAGLALHNNANLFLGAYGDVIIGSGASTVFSNSYERMRIKGGGNVGIGTTNPTRMLHLSTTGDAGIFLEADYLGTAAEDNNAFIRFSQDGGGVEAILGLVGNTGVDPENNAYGSVINNAALLGTIEAWPLQFGTNSAVRMTLDSSTGNVGIGLTNPGTRLDVSGTLRNSLATTHSLLGAAGNVMVLADNNGTLYTGPVFVSGGYLPLSGGTMTGAVNMGNNNITGVAQLTATKIQANTFDPVYTINGINYSTYAPSIAGGVREEYVGKVKLDSLSAAAGEYEAVIDFADQPTGSDLWLWRQSVDFNKENVDIAITPYGGFARVYYLIDDNRLILRSDRQIELSYRLIGRRFDWRDWPTLSDDQETRGLEPK